MVIIIPLPKRRWGGGHDLGVVMATPILLLKGKQASYGLLVLRQRGAMVAILILLSSTLLLLITRMVWSGSPSSSFQRGGGEVVMPHSLLSWPSPSFF